MSPASDTRLPDPRILDALAVLRGKASEPRVGLVLGSGLGAFAEVLDAEYRISCADIPHFRQPSVPGHAGAFTLGRLEGVPVACLGGRVHRYEGHAVTDVVFGSRLLGGRHRDHAEARVAHAHRRSPEPDGRDAARRTRVRGHDDGL